MKAMTDTTDYDFESPEGVRPPGFLLRALEARMVRNFLIQRGYAAHGWGQGINFGPSPNVIEACVERVRSVIMLGSPINVPASASNARRLYRAVRGRHAHHPAYSALLKHPPHVPTTSIFSRSDGVVAW